MDKFELIEAEKSLKEVLKLARRYYSYVPDEKRGLVTIEDLKSAGYEGLVEAAGKYDARKKVEFTTYAHNWIKGRIIDEMIFYIGKDALLMDGREMYTYKEKSSEEQAMDTAGFDDIPDDEKCRIITSALKSYGLTPDEVKVFLAVNGVGEPKVTNLSKLAKRMGKRAMEIRRIRQIAEEKVKKSLK